MPELDVVGAVERLTGALERAAIDYALSGAIALAYWTAPRATLDIDVCVDVDPAALPGLLDALREAGSEVPADAAAQAQRGALGVRLGGVRVDVFLPLLPIAEEAMARRMRVPFAEREVWILSAEDLALFKILFARTKDWADLERLLAARAGRLDRSYIESRIGSLLDPGDPRLARYRELAERGRRPARDAGA